LPLLQIQPVIDAIDPQPARRPALARARMHLQGQALQPADGGVVAVDDSDGRSRSCSASSIRAVRFSIASVWICTPAFRRTGRQPPGQIIGLGPDQPRTWPMPDHRRRRSGARAPAEARTEEGAVERDPFATESSEDNLRAAVVDASAQEAAATVAAFHGFAVITGRSKASTSLANTHGCR